MFCILLISDFFYVLNFAAIWSVKAKFLERFIYLHGAYTPLIRHFLFIYKSNNGKMMI